MDLLVVYELTVLVDRCSLACIVVATVMAYLVADTMIPIQYPSGENFTSSLKAIKATADYNRLSLVQKDEISHYGREQKAYCLSTSFATPFLREAYDHAQWTELSYKLQYILS